jgi:energy-coupling factor transporter ATP-binding protein EcfA2
MSDSAWTLTPDSFLMKLDRRSNLSKLASGSSGKDIEFKNFVPLIRTTAGDEISPDLIPSKVRGNIEDRSASKLIAMLNQEITKESTSSTKDTGTCETESDKEGGLTSFIYQDFLRRYIEMNTPERGILIYHGLGSGKTATSIGMIEANISERPDKIVYVILPASLRDNYRSEIRKFSPVIFGNGLLSEVKYWNYIPLESTGEKTDELSKQTGIPAPVLVENGGIFVIGTKGTPRMEMDSESRRRLDKQIVEMLLSQIRFISSNGLSKERALALNFNDSIVVIDEVHKVSGMVRNERGGGSKKSGGLAVGGIGRILYNKIKDAKRAKVIALSGTPLINSPFEIAILANMIRGKIEKIRIPYSLASSRKGDDIAEDAILRDVYMDPIIRYATIEPSTEKGRGNELVIIRHPEGFESVMTQGTNEYIGIYRSDSEESTAPDWIDRFVRRMATKGIILDRAHSKETVGMWFPEKEDDFLRIYTSDGGIQHEESLMRRLMLISYYRGADPRRLPRTREIQIVETEMSGPQFEEYARARYQENEMASRAKEKGRGGGDGDEDGDDFTGRYRTRQLCNFFIPFTRPTISGVKNDLRMRGIEVDDKAVEIEYDRQIDGTIARIREMPDIITNLGTYSPKMKGILDLLESSEGLSLIYSSFLRMEGLELMGIVLEKAGYYPIKLVGDPVNPRIEALTNDETREGFIKAKHKRFILFSGETEEEFRPYVIRMYRGEFDRLPESLRDDIRTVLGDEMADNGLDNLRGELCRILMITSAGAEGLNLKAVRSIHILEPYWNKARLDQVFGRGVRLCSHMSLPISDRTVERYIHISKFPEKIYDEMIARGTNMFLQSTDNNQSTDQYLYELSKRKEAINGAFVELMRRSSVDCPLNADANGMLLSECYVSPRGKEYLRHLISPDYKDDLDDSNRIIEEDTIDTVVLEVGRSIFEPDDIDSPIEMGPVQVAVDTRTMVVYDPNLMTIRRPERIGRLVIRQDPETGADVATVLLDDSFIMKPSSGTPGTMPGSKMSAGVGSGAGAGAAVAATPGTSPGVDEAERMIASEIGGKRSNDSKYKIGTRPQPYKTLFEGLSPESRKTKMERLAREYAQKYLLTMTPSEKIDEKIFILLMGHPGAGKSSSIQKIVETVYPIINRKTGKIISFEQYSFVNVDAIIGMMKEYQDRLLIRRDDDGTIVVDKNVIEDKDIRELGNAIRDIVCEQLLLQGVPIIYESLFTNPRHVVSEVLDKAISMGYTTKGATGMPEGAAAAAAGALEGVSTGLMIVMNLYTTNLDETLSRVRSRFQQTGRYIGNESDKSFVKTVWEEHKAKRRSGEYQNTFLKMTGKYHTKIPVDIYLEINTDEEEPVISLLQK